jgi:hypothetical protein
MIKVKRKNQGSKKLYFTYTSLESLESFHESEKQVDKMRCSPKKKEAMPSTFDRDMKTMQVEA